MSTAADFNLLLGLVALQNHFIDQADLLAAFPRWSEDRSRSLVQVLKDRNALNDDSARFLEALVAKHLARFGGDAARGLAALSSIESAREALTKLADPDVTASLGHVPFRGVDERDEYATRASTASELLGSRFRVLRFHARGGLGQVSVALDKELGREVAFKEIQDQHADHPESRVRFEFEAEITGGLEHPGIVPVYSLGHDQTGRPFYAMRFIRGDNLQDAIKRFRDADSDPTRDPGEREVSLRKLLGRFLDVCNAIAYAHSRGVLHRDLKPGNIMLGDYGETLVVDWGLAKLVDAPDAVSDEPSLRPASTSGSTKTEAGRVVGTPAFMSPEQALGRLDDLGPASDVYSLGATLYALLAGQPPYEGRPQDVVAQVPRGAFPLPRRIDPRIPRPLESICLKAMKVDAAERYPTARALAEDLEHWLADERVSAHPETLAARVARWTRRHKSATLAAAAALVAISAVSMTAFFVVRKALTAEQAALIAQRKATEAADRDRARAEVRETMAVDAIKKFETAVIENPELKNSPNLKPLRDTLLKEPLRFSERLRELLQADGDSRPESLTRLAAACASLAATTGMIGNKDGALKAYHETLNIRERLMREHPSVPEHAANFALTLGEMGIIQGATGQTDQAFASHRRALEIRERLVRENPSVQKYQWYLSNSYNNLGVLQSSTGQADMAMKSLGEALKIRDRLARDNPANTLYQVGLAYNHDSIGHLYMDMQKLDLALASYDRSRQIQERLIADKSSEPNYRIGLANTLREIGLLQHDTGQLDLALKTYNQAMDICQRMAKDYPSVIGYQADLAVTYNSIAGFQFDAGQIELSRKSLDRAREIGEQLVREHPTVTNFQSALAQTHNTTATNHARNDQFDLALKSLGRALEINERLMRENPSVTYHRRALGLNHYNIACVLCLQAARSKDPKVTKSLSDQAMEAIRRADVSGFSLWKQASEDPDLKPLRGRPELEELLKAKLKPKDAGAK